MQKPASFQIATTMTQASAVSAVPSQLWARTPALLPLIAGADSSHTGVIIRAGINYRSQLGRSGCRQPLIGWQAL